MTNNWSDIFEQNFQEPETIDIAVNRLMMILEGEHKVALATMQKEELVELQISLGTAIQNAFRLRNPGSKLLASCGVACADDASGLIIKTLWTRLKYGD
ncbi:MAG: hypothetical protein PHG00_03520 [Methylococcales bacterium]|nr:hypothetical protein [Methylococcales bacterium]